MRAGIEIFSRVVRGIRTADDDHGAGAAGQRNHLERMPLGHHVDVDADHRRTPGGQKRAEVAQRLEGPVEHTDIEPARLQVCREIENP